MIKLSNGVELSEDTVVSALKKAGINVEPKRVFKYGDVVAAGMTGIRIIINTYAGVLIAVDKHGVQRGNDADKDGRFRDCGYKYVGRLSDMI